MNLISIMASVVKDSLYVGTYHLPSGPFEVRADELPHYRQRTKDMLAAGLKIPISWAHQKSIRPTNQEDFERAMAAKEKLVLGHVTGATLGDDPILAMNLEIPDAADVNQCKKVRFVSPTIVEDYRDPTGRLWPGKSIVQLAVTSRPAQLQQKPFDLGGQGQGGREFNLSLETFKTSINLGDTAMADDKDPKETPAETGGEGGAADKGAMLKKVVDALASCGMSLGDDVTEANLFDRLYAAALTKNSSDGGAAATDPEEDDVSNATTDDLKEIKEIAMSALTKATKAEAEVDLVRATNISLSARLIGQERRDLAQRINALASRGVPKTTRDAMLTELKTVNLSLDNGGKVVMVPLVAKLRGYEDLPKQFGAITEREAADLSEVDPDAGVSGVVNDRETIDGALEMMGHRRAK